MSQQACGKICTPEEIRQIEATRKEELTKEIGGKKFESATNELEMRLIAIENMKAELRHQSNQKAQSTSSKPKTVEIYGNPKEKHTDEASILQVASERAAKKYYVDPINPKDFTEKYDHNKPIDPNSKTIDSDNYDFQKTIGEKQAEAVMFQELGMEVVAFDTKNTGFDNIGTYLCKDKNGCLVIIEAKCTQSKDGRSDLSTDTQHLKQASKPWIQDRLNAMKDPESRLYSAANAKFAEEALKKVGDGNLDRYIIHTNVNTLNIIVSKAHNDEDWQYHSAYRSLESER